MTMSLTEWAAQNQAYIMDRLDETSMMRGFRELRPYQREALNALLDPNVEWITVGGHRYPPHTVVFDTKTGERIPITRLASTRRKEPLEQTFVEVTTPVRPSDAILGLTIPDRASVEIKSPYFSNDTHRYRVRFGGKERNNDVVEFCISEGWIRVHVRTPKGKFKMERGNFVTVKLHGTVEVFWKD